MIAIAILGIISVTIYQFVDTTLRAATFSEQSGAEDAAFSGLRRLVSAQLAGLPVNQSGALVGMTIHRGSGRRDALQLLCPAGNAVLTPDARGFYQVTLDLRESPRGSGRFALGLERQPWTDDNEDDGDEDENQPQTTALSATDLRPGRSAARMPGDWVKLMDNVRELEIAYFDSRLNGWVDKWTDQAALPNLVRVRLATLGRPEPYEIVMRVPGGGVKRIIPTATLTNLTNGAGTLTNGALQSNTASNVTFRTPLPTRPAAPANGFHPAPIPGNTNGAIFKSPH